MQNEKKNCALQRKKKIDYINNYVYALFRIECTIQLPRAKALGSYRYTIHINCYTLHRLNI